MTKDMTAVADEIERLIEKEPVGSWSLYATLFNNATAIVTALREAEKYKTALHHIAKDYGFSGAGEIARTALGEP